MAQDRAELQHFLYPLNPNSAVGYFFGDENGVEYPTSYEGFAAAEYGRRSEWSLVTGFNKVRTQDMVWAYFARPDGAIRAVGRIPSLPHWNEEWSRWAIWIDWDHELTDRLARNPIFYEQFGQRVQSAILRANPSTLRVLSQWLRNNQRQSSRARDEAVRFTTREVETRLGQAEFRSGLMRAYDNRCAISDCDVEVVLQAAHIRAVKDGGDHSSRNGLLLRSDLHNLFDSGLITISDKFTVIVSRQIRGGHYGEIHGRKLRLPAHSSDRPRLVDVRRHRTLFVS